MEEMRIPRWVSPVFVLTVLIFGLVGCSSTPTPEQPTLVTPEATATAEVVQPPTPEPATPQPTTEIPKISQPIARWNSVSERDTWVLVGYGDALNPTVVEPGTYVTINFSNSDNQVSGSGGCNNYFSTYSADDEYNLTINGPVGSTRMACDTGMEQETLYLSALETVSGYDINENGLLLLDYESGTAYDEQLVFVPQTPLVGTTWVLVAYGDSDDLTPSEPGVMTTAIFSADGSVSGSTGCNSYSVGYTLNGSQINFGLPISNLKACATGAKQESDYLAFFENAQTYQLGIDALEIRSGDGSQVMRFSSQNLPLENVRWQLSSINGQPLPEGVSVNVIFTPGDSPIAQGGENTISGNGGCNTFTGSYSLTGETFTTSPLAQTQMMCEESAIRIEEIFVTGLQNVKSYQIILDQLTIITASSSLLFDADRLPLEGPRWILTGSGAADNPQPPSDGAVFIANFERQFGMPSGVKSGTTGCNDYTATYTASFDEFKVNLPQTSQNTCSAAQTEAEQHYFLSLNAARDYLILGNEMYVYYDNFVLIFVGSYPTNSTSANSPVSDNESLAPLDGTEWELTAIGAKPVIPNSLTTLLFEINTDGQSGKISGQAGCNIYSAKITANFALGPFNVTSVFCDSPPGIMEQQATYLDTLQNANDYRLRGDTLEIRCDPEILYFKSTGPEAIQPTPIPNGPQAVIVAPSNVFVDQKVTYDASLSTSNAEIVAYRWWFSDDTTAEGLTVERTYHNAKPQDAILTITDANGQKSEASVKVNVNMRLVGTTWVRDGTTITLIFGDGSLSGNAGCNDYSAGYTAQTEPGVANSLKIEQISATDKVCDANVMTREQSYLGTLQSASSYIINGIRLTITTAGEQLIFYPSTVKP